jgi:Effector Associated Constant Component 1
MGDSSISIRISGRQAEQDLRSFCDWLRLEPDVSRHARISLTSAEPRPGEMGAALEAIQLVTDGSFQTLSLALAYASWRGTRPGRSKVTIERRGSTVTLEDADPDTVNKIIRALE